MDANTIVVGFDDSAGAARALQWARQEARLRDASLEVVHVYQPPSYALLAGNPYALPEMEAEAKDHAARVLDNAVRDIDDVKVETVAVEAADAAKPLIARSREAAMLVVGSRGHGGFAGLLLGSVSQKCVQHAACPVAVVRQLPEQHVDS